MAEMKSFLWVQFKGTQAGRVCFNQLVFARTAVVSNPSMAAASIELRDTHWATLKPLLSDKFTLDTIKVWCNQAPDGSNIPAFTRLVGETGEVDDSQPIAAWLAVNMLKIPNNEEKFPTEAADFEMGRTGWSGVTEDQVDNGFLIDGALTNWQSAMETFEQVTFDVSGTPTTWGLVIFRASVGGQDVVVPVLETDVAQQLGRRGSRWT